MLEYQTDGTLSLTITTKKLTSQKFRKPLYLQTKHGAYELYMFLKNIIHVHRPIIENGELDNGFVARKSCEGKYTKNKT